MRVLGTLLLLTFVSQFGQAETSRKEKRYRYLVTFRQPSVVEEVLADRKSDSRRLKRQALRSSAIGDRRSRVDQTQLQVINRLTAQQNRATGSEADIEIVDRRIFLTNSMVIRATDFAAASLRKDPQVRAVVPDQIRYPSLDSAPMVVKAPAIWEAIPGGVSNAGRGVRIAVIDSGINQEHAMFGGEGLTPPPGFPAGSSLHTNAKVIVARTYPHLFPNPQPNRTPDDEMGHGSRVAAVAAGRQLEAPLASIQGIAPMAFLGSYKVFGSPGQNSKTTSGAIIAALNDAVSDGMDVINLSLGGEGVDPATDPEQQAIALAVAAGTVVVAAAGNSGPRSSTIRSPGTSPDAITVGAVTNARFFGPALTVFMGSPSRPFIDLAYTPGTGVSLRDPLGPMPLISIAFLDESELACNPFPAGALDGRMVLVRRGTCLFQDKADNVFAAGGGAMIVYNNVDGTSIVMAFDEERGPGGPAVMIEKGAGEVLRDLSDSHLWATLRSEDDLASFPAQADIIVGFSSRGPNIDSSIKPDLTAVGSGIYSASNRPSEFTLNSNGTSFSAPMVAGAAALIIQLHPDWAPRTVKSTLVTTADPSPTWDGEFAGVLLTGTGRLDLEKALGVTAMVDPVSLSFGRIEVDSAESVTARRSFLLRNLADEERAFDLVCSLTEINPSAQISITPTTVELDPLESIQVEVVLEALRPMVEGSFEGFLYIRDRTSGSELSVPLWGNVIVTGQTNVLEVSKLASAPFQDLADAIGSARSGNVIEITDSATYPETLIIHENNHGAPLHHLTLRSRPGENPVIEAHPEDSAVITVQDVNDLTIEGLELRGGKRGISLINSTGLVRDNRILSFPPDSSGSGIHLADSAAHLQGNELIQIGGSGVSALGSEALIQYNSISSSLIPTPNATTGIFATSESSLAVFDNTIQHLTVEKNASRGIEVLSSSALIKANLISASSGEPGSGVFAHGDRTELWLQDNLIMENKGVGVYLTAGAQVNLLRDRIAANEGPGLVLRDQSRLLAEAVEVDRNDAGLIASDSSAELSNLIFSAAAGDGLFTERSTLAMANCTVFGNNGTGMRIVSPIAENLIANSIFSENMDGSLSGLTSSEVFYNLIGDAQFEGLNGNFTGEAQLVAPEESCFVPLPDSPVIDAGDNSLVRSTGDLRSHLRFKDGNLDGSIIVDVGAIEFGSDFSTPLVLPLLTVDPKKWLGLAISNAYQPVDPGPSHEEALPETSKIRFTLLDTDGHMLDQKELAVPGGTQRTILLSEEYESLQNGWITLEASGPDVVSFALLGNWEASILDGVPLVPALGRLLVFPEIRNESAQTTTLFLANPNVVPASVLLKWYDQTGSLLKSSLPISIPPSGMYQSRISELFGPGSSGYVVAEVLTPEPVHAMELFGTQEAVAALLALRFDSGAGELYAAQLVSNDSVRTILNVINTGTNSEEITLEAIAENGEVLATSDRILSSGAQLRLAAREIFSLESPTEGWVRIRSDSERLLGAVTFQAPNGNWMAALPLQSHPAREFILSHVAHTPSIFTGVTLLNPTIEKTLVSFEVFDAQGQETGRSDLLLPAACKKALLLNEWVPELDNQTGGFIRIRSTRGLIGFELFGSYTLDYVSAVPQQVTVH